MPFAYERIPYIFGIGIETIMMTIATIAFFIAAERRASREGIRGKDYVWFFIWLFLSGLAGGRIWHFIENWQGWISLAHMLDLRREGLVSWGMLLGGFLFLMLYAFWRKKGSEEKGALDKGWLLEFWKICDAIAMPLALWIGIYRIGCHFWGDVPGTLTNVPWALQHVNGMLRHPTAIYLSLSGFLIFILLIAVFGWKKERRRFEGELIGWFMLLYTFNRFWIEFLRANAARYYGLDAGQIVAAIIFIIAAGLMINGYREWVLLEK